MIDVAALGLVIAGLLVHDTIPAGGELPTGEERVARLIASDPVLDGHGPAQRFTVRAPAPGWFYIQASAAPGSVFVRVTNAAATLDGKEGCVAWTPCVIAPVKQGMQLDVTISACETIADGTSLDVTVNAVFSPETAESLALAQQLDAAIEQHAALAKANEPDAARAVIVDAAHRLVDLEWSASSHAISAAALAVAEAAFNCGAGAESLLACRHALAHRDRALPSDHPQRVSVLSNLGVGLHMRGDLDGAAEVFEQVVAIEERTLPETHPRLLSTQSNLAGIYLALGDATAARALFEQVLAVRERALGEDHPAVQQSRSALASAFFQLGDLANARALGEKSLAVQQRTLSEDDPALQLTRANLALVVKGEGDLEAARALLERVVASRERTLAAEHPDLLSAQQNLSTVLEELGDFAGSRALKEMVLPACERAFPPNHIQVLAARQSLALTLYMTGELAQARSLLESVLASIERSAYGADDDRLKDTRKTLFTVCMAQGDATAAAPLLEALVHSSMARARTLLSTPAREAAERAAKELDVVQLLLQYPEVAPSDAVDQAFELAATTSMIAAGAAPIGAHDDAEVGALRDTLAAARAALSQRTLAGPTQGAKGEAFGNEIYALARDRDAAEAALLTALRERGATTEPIGAAALARALPADHAVVQLVAVENLVRARGAMTRKTGQSVVAMVIVPSAATTPGPFVQRVTLCDLEAMRTAVTKWRGEIAAMAELGADQIGASEAEHARALRRLVVDPLLAAIPGTLVLHITLDDAMHLVPIEALPLDDGGFVGDRMRVVIEPSCDRLLRARRQSLGKTTLIVVGDVDYGAAQSPRFGPLPGTGDEVRAIAARFTNVFEREPVRLLQTLATREGLASGVVGARYVHVATHGWFAPDSIRSREDPTQSSAGAVRVLGLAPSVLCGIALAGANAPNDRRGRPKGLMTAEELAGIDLSNCSLCVLSACETNVGVRRAGLGMRSLQAAVHTAGARSAITTLWSVDDTSTRRLMDLLYENLWDKQLRTADALWLAKSTLRSEGADTSQWAAFVLSGDPDSY